MLNFKPGFSLSSFTLIKFFSSSLLSAIKEVSAYLKLLICLLGILSPVYESSSLAFHMMYSTQRLNKQSDNIQPCHTPFPILNLSFVPCLILTLASCPSQETGKVIWYSHHFNSFAQFVVIHTVKGFSVINEAEVDIFSETPLLSP